TWPEAKVREFKLNGAALTKSLEQSRCATVVLHYVGYAYQPKGIPVWLPRALRQWRHGGKSATPSAPRRLVVMFHEMYARSSPLRSPFWVGPFARRIIRDLVTLSDAWVTSCERYHRQLTTEFGAEKTEGRILPIPSNIPAPGEITFEETRGGRLRAVLFGLAKTRLWALERHWQLLRALHQASRLEHITLMGKRPEPEDERAWQSWSERIGPGVKWRQRFDLSTSEISAELAQHDLGLLANEPDILTKSGVFAALATHGVIPIVSTPAGEALPESVARAALANDDGGAIAPLVAALRDATLLRPRRDELLAFAARELAWPGIARNWADVLSGTGARKSAGPWPTAESASELPNERTLGVSA
ncbi:MAG TPA: hypothetical protein VM029_18175, partial [Opitutaceae bacterium]|nr:hypothetical protein [Opitutaceae bacterium]